MPPLTVHNVHRHVTRSAPSGGRLAERVFSPGGLDRDTLAKARALKTTLPLCAKRKPVSSHR